jgi:hypothetical protein
MRQVFVVLLVGLTGYLPTGSLATGAEYWNQFRGPQGDRNAATAALPIKWSETENIVWKTAIDGKAWSSLVVWENEIWLTNATTDGKRLSAVGKGG